MSDLIDRQAAIDALAKAVTEGYGIDCGVIHSDVIYEILQDLPSVQPQPNWIPCSERLPEDSDDVLITYVFDYGKSCPDDIKALLESDEGAYVLFNPKKVWEMPHITIAHYYDGTEDGEPSEWCYDNECYSMPEEVRVIAWMPLPEPYMED